MDHIQELEILMPLRDSVNGVFKASLVLPRASDNLQTVCAKISADGAEVQQHNTTGN